MSVLTRLTPPIPNEFGWPNGSDDIAPDMAAVILTNAAQRMELAGLLLKQATTYADVQPFINFDIEQDYLDLAYKVLGMQPITFNPSTDSLSPDIHWHVSITPNATTPGAFDVAIEHTNELISLDFIEADISESTDGQYHLSIVPQPGFVGDPAFAFKPVFQYPALPTDTDAPITDVVINMIAHGSPPTGSVSGTTLTLNLPSALDGTDGTNGTDGITPQLRSIGGEIEVSYDNGSTWSNLFPVPADGITPQLRSIGGEIEVSYDNGSTWSNLFPIPADGITPQFDAPTAVGLSYGSAPTIVQSGDGSSATPYHQTFGIPAGAPGADGSFSEPGLPTGTDTVTIELPVVATGTFLPWKIPGGYKFQVTGGWGQWGSTQALAPAGIWNYIGIGENSYGYAAHDAAYPVGQVVAQIFDNGGNLISVGGHSYLDPISGQITMPQDGYVALSINCSAAGVASNLIVNLTVQANNPTWSYDIDLTASEGSWLPEHDGSGDYAVWSSGNGFENGGSAQPLVLNAGIPILENSHIVSGSAYWSTSGIYPDTVSVEFAVETARGGTTVTPTLYSNGSVPLGSDGSHVTTFATDHDLTPGEFLFFYFEAADATAQGAIKLTRVTLQGTGPYPFT